MIFLYFLLSDLVVGKESVALRLTFEAVKYNWLSLGIVKLKLGVVTICITTTRILVIAQWVDSSKLQQRIPLCLLVLDCGHTVASFKEGRLKRDKGNDQKAMTRYSKTYNKDHKITAHTLQFY